MTVLNQAPLGDGFLAPPRATLNPYAISRAGGWILVVVALMVWELSARSGLVSSQSWPPFTDVLKATAEGLYSGELSGVLLSTLMRMLTGFVIGGAIGVILGLLIGTIPVLHRLLSPLVEALRPLPIPAIVPPLILFLGIDDTLKVFVVSLAVVFPVLINTTGGIRNIDSVLMQTARTFRKGPLYRLFFVTLPAAMPAILAGLRISLSLALVTTIVAEMIAGSGGVGYFLIVTQYGMQPAKMYAAILCLAALGYLLNRGFVLVEDRLVAWDRRSEVSA